MVRDTRVDEVSSELTVLECVGLFDEDFADALLALIDVVVADSVYNELLQLGELSQTARCNRLGHLLVVVAQLADLLQLTHIEVDLLLVLLFKSLPKAQTQPSARTQLRCRGQSAIPLTASLGLRARCLRDFIA